MHSLGVSARRGRGAGHAPLFFARRVPRSLPALCLPGPHAHFTDAGAHTPCSVCPALLLVPRSSLLRTAAPAPGAAAAAEGEAKVAWPWEAPTDPLKWKEEHFVLTILACWGVVIYGGMKSMGGGSKEAAPAAAEGGDDAEWAQWAAAMEAEEAK